MIDQANKYEETLSIGIKEKFSSFDETRSIENELNQIEKISRSKSFD